MASPRLTGMGEASWKVAGYLVDAPLGQGASARVWRGHVARTGDRVALKRIDLHDSGQILRARAEAALLAALDHPHLIRLHELVQTADCVVLVLDLADGGSLDDLLAVRGRLSPGEVITAVAPVGAALAYAHDAGVVHGDVSTANILFTSNGLPMLADLGVARLLGDLAPAQSTPAYLDPAVAAGSLPGPQSDVFMLAAVALHALTGAPPWRGDTGAAALAAARTGDLSDLDDRLAAAGVPDQMCEVLRRALALEPARRGSAADFALDLRWSGQPVVVELRAGRAPVKPLASGLDPVGDVGVVAAPGPAAVPGTSNGLTSEGVAGVPAGNRPSLAAGDAPGRPAFDRPNLDPGIDDGSAEPGPAQTHLVHSQPRPPRPSGGHRYQPAAGNRRSIRWAVVGIAAAAVLAGAGVAWAVAGDGSKHPAPHPSTSAQQSLPGVVALPPQLGTAGESLSASTQPAPTPASTAPATSAASMSSAGASSVLIQLDALRERAYARRSAVLLTGVYEPGALLDEDTASLQRIVPSGCGLEGVHTTYAQVKVTGHHGDEVDVSARATLSTSVLYCNGVAKAQAPGSGPTALNIVLVKSGASYLIRSVQS